MAFEVKVLSKEEADAQWAELDAEDTLDICRRLHPNKCGDREDPYIKALVSAYVIGIRTPGAGRLKMQLAMDPDDIAARQRYHDALPATHCEGPRITDTTVIRREKQRRELPLSYRGDNRRRSA